MAREPAPADPAARSVGERVAAQACLAGLDDNLGAGSDATGGCPDKSGNSGRNVRTLIIVCGCCPDRGSNGSRS